MSSTPTIPLEGSEDDPAVLNISSTSATSMGFLKRKRLDHGESTSSKCTSSGEPGCSGRSSSDGEDAHMSDISQSMHEDAPVEQGTSPTSHSSFRRAAAGLNGKGRLSMLQEMHTALGGFFDLRDAAGVAAQLDDLPCFLYAHDNGAFHYESPMVFAVAHGALSILEYGFQHRDEILWYCPDGFAGCTWDRSLRVAARGGHLACVRFLHRNGAKMWDRVDVTCDYWAESLRSIFKGWVDWPATSLTVPTSRHLVEPLWGVLRYGEMHGAPLPESATGLFKERRARAREVVMCFHRAARLSRRGGKDGAMWGAMGRVPIDLLHNILLGAELEMEETLKPGAFGI